MVKKFDDTVIRFDRIHERDRYTDRQTDRHRMAASELDMHGSGPSMGRVGSGWVGLGHKFLRLG